MPVLDFGTSSGGLRTNSVKVRCIVGRCLLGVVPIVFDWAKKSSCGIIIEPTPKFVVGIYQSWGVRKC